jgi:hypothetical protein
MQHTTLDSAHTTHAKAIPGALGPLLALTALSMLVAFQGSYYPQCNCHNINHSYPFQFPLFPLNWPRASSPLQQFDPAIPVYLCLSVTPDQDSCLDSRIQSYIC